MVTNHGKAFSRVSILVRNGPAQHGLFGDCIPRVWGRKQPRSILSDASLLSRNPVQSLGGIALVPLSGESSRFFMESGCIFHTTIRVPSRSCPIGVSLLSDCARVGYCHAICWLCLYGSAQQFSDSACFSEFLLQEPQIRFHGGICPSDVCPGFFCARNNHLRPVSTYLSTLTRPIDLLPNPSSIDTKPDMSSIFGLTHRYFYADRL